ncbi:hypothetical protein [Tenacibaculum agarivorans]|uniref:hypothetical protein n=1 Tax=Tenacibaculum agarivorans TaxID=1908389 RepID=UPI00094BC36F|nr:hypothetical protein [Tenacibaculum agarivorans]
MGYGGAVSAMITSLKNNKRSRKSAIKKLKERGYLGHKISNQLHFTKEATPKQLEQIRNRIRKENQKKLLVHLSVIVTFSLIALLAIGFVKF